MANKPLLVTAVIVSCAAAGQAQTYIVAPGACPWHDRESLWEILEVPDAVCGGGPIPQQSCGSRILTIPEGAPAAVFAVNQSDLARIRGCEPGVRETDLWLTLESRGLNRRIRYRVMVHPEPAAELTFGRVCRAGLILLKLDDTGIDSRPFEAPAPPDKSLAERSSFHLYLLIGQSNMAGRGRVEPQDLAINPRVLALNEEDRWEVAVDPIHFDKPIAGVCLGTTFGKVMAERHPDAVIGLIPCAVGGTRLAQWQPDAEPTPPWGHLYSNAVRRTLIALRDGVLRGILWHQGEGDANTGAIARYADGLRRLRARLEEDLGVSNMPFVAGDLGVWDEERHRGRQAFNENLADLPTWFPNAAVVSADGLGHLGDGTHFDNAALRELGRRYADALTALRSR